MTLDKLANFLLLIGAAGPAGSAQTRRDALNTALAVAELQQRQKEFEEKQRLARQRLGMEAYRTQKTLELAEKELALEQSRLEWEKEKLEKTIQAYRELMEAMYGEPEETQATVQKQLEEVKNQLRIVLPAPPTSPRATAPPPSEEAEQPPQLSPYIPGLYSPAPQESIFQKWTEAPSVPDVNETQRNPWSGEEGTIYVP